MASTASTVPSAVSAPHVYASVEPTYARLVGNWRRPLVSGAEAKRLNQALQGSRPIRGVAVALGKFDAMHIGHASLVQRAREMGALPCLLSFHGMATVLGLPHRQPLTAEGDRARILRSWAPLLGDVVPIQRSIPFADVRHLQPEAFVELLADELKVIGVVAGSNYRFGYKARGDAELLRACGQAHGLTVDIVELQDAAEATLGKASSTSVRNLVTTGDFGPIPSYLGRRYSLLVPRLALQAVGEQHREDTAVVWDFPAEGAINQVPGDGGYAVRVFDRAEEDKGGLDYAGAEGSLSVRYGVCRLVLCERFYAGDKGLRIDFLVAQDVAAMSALHCEAVATSAGDFQP